MRRKLGEQRDPSSGRFNCFLTVVYAKQFGFVGQQQPTVGENKSDSGGGRSQEVDRKYIEESTQQGKPLHGILKAKGGEGDQRTHFAEKWRQT
ncbi:unnamed protein product [Schistosoma curassoni]|uniref:Uncharacterized protein n=1 Tax=Schistosoma curassoni TaxID=6186 RepID=A0A183L0Q6_9TREM|nr:unnamed protein product [Schistosoma curassoni]